MSIITSNMGLRSWPAVTDKFSFSDLHANFNKIDAHDHSDGNGVQIGTNAIPALAITAPKFGADLTSSRFAAGSLSYDKLTNPPLGVPRLLLSVHMQVQQNLVSISQVQCPKRQPFGMLGSTTQVDPIWFQYNSADWAISGRTTQLTFRGMYATNNVAGGTVTNSFGIWPISSWGGFGGMPAATLGGSAFQSFSLVPSVAANQTVIFAQQNITAPADGTSYAFAVSSNAGTGAPFTTQCTFALCWRMGIRWV